MKDAASGRGGSVCKLPPDEDLNRRGGVESPEGQVKTSLSLSLSLVSPCYVNTCVFCCSLSLLSGRRDALGASLTNITKVPRVDVAGEARGEGRLCTRNFEAGESRGPRDCLGESTHLTGGRIHLDSEERFRKRAVIGERTLFEKRDRTSL